MNKLMIAIVITLAWTSAHAQALRVVEVAAPAINCVFDPTCRVAVSDTTDTVPLPAGGTNFLQSRTVRGRPGSAADGLYVYEYRLDLRRAEGILYIPCLDSLSIDFGPVVSTLDLDGNGKDGDEVFVVTRGGLGSVGVASAEKSGRTITFRFANSVCAGGRPNAGQSTFFFGLISTHAPAGTTATILESTGKTYEVQARAARQKDPLQEQIPQEVPIKRPIPIPNRRSTREPKGDQPVPVPKRREAHNLPDAVVERLTPQPCVDKLGTVTISGSRFGRWQGSRVVELGGHGIGVLLKVTSWSDTKITAIVLNDPRIEYGQWYYIGLQEQDRHWISNISRTINICRQLE